jgi:hypothetical protein
VLPRLFTRDVYRFYSFGQSGLGGESRDAWAPGYLVPVEER